MGAIPLCAPRRKEIWEIRLCLPTQMAEPRRLVPRLQGRTRDKKDTPTVRLMQTCTCSSPHPKAIFTTKYVGVGGKRKSSAHVAVLHTSSFPAI